MMEPTAAAAMWIGLALAALWCVGLLRLYRLLRQPWWIVWAAAIGLWIARQAVTLASWKWHWWIEEWMGTPKETILALFITYGMLIWGAELAIARSQIRKKQLSEIEIPKSGGEE